MGRKKRATGAEVLEGLPALIGWLGQLPDRSSLILAPGLLAPVGPLLQPGLDGFPGGIARAAYPIADWTITPVRQRYRV